MNDFEFELRHLRPRMIKPTPPWFIPWIHNRPDNGLRCAERWVPPEGACSVCGRINFVDPAETVIRELIRMKEASR